MKSSGWKTQLMIMGAVVGALGGVMAARMFIQSGEEATGSRGRPRIKPKHALQVGIGVIGLLQKIAGLSEK